MASVVLPLDGRLKQFKQEENYCDTKFKQPDLVYGISEFRHSGAVSLLHLLSAAASPPHAIKKPPVSQCHRRLTNALPIIARNAGFI